MKNFPEKKIAQIAQEVRKHNQNFFSQGRVEDFATYIIKHMTYICEGEEEMGKKKALETLIECDKIGKRTKADKAHIQNLNIQRKLENSHVEDVGDSEDDKYLPKDHEDLFLCIFRCVLVSIRYANGSARFI